MKLITSNHEPSSDELRKRIVGLNSLKLVGRGKWRDASMNVVRAGEQQFGWKYAKYNEITEDAGHEARSILKTVSPEFWQVLKVNQFEILCSFNEGRSRTAWCIIGDLSQHNGPFNKFVPYSDEDKLMRYLHQHNLSWDIFLTRTEKSVMPVRPLSQAHLFCYLLHLTRNIL